MKCPHCWKSLSVPDQAFIAVKHKKKKVVSVTLCCGKMVELVPNASFKRFPSDRKIDDWGNTIK